MDHFFPLRVVSLAAETCDAKIITLGVPEAWAEQFHFLPGQHLIVRALLDGSEVRRAYSICSADHEPLRIVVKRVPDGQFSTWANGQLECGDLLECMPPRGHFCGPLEPALARRHVAFAGGSGIAPVFSILKAVLATEPHSDFTLFYGNATSSTILLREVLQELKDRYPSRFSLQFILSREETDVALWHGRIDRAKCDALLEKWLDPRSIDVAYLCAPAGMMDAVCQSLLAHGIPPARIRTERYAGDRPARYSHAGAHVGGVCRITLIQDGHVRQFSSFKSHQTLLDAALEHSLDVPYACKAGVCTTCRCKLLRGEVEQGDMSALEEDEMAQGFILACQSVPLSDELTIDYDR